MEIPYSLKNFLEENVIVGNVAIGNDIVYLPHFEKSLNPLFKKKVYTENEINYCETFDQSLLRYASTWAAKEASYKAFKQLNNSLIGWKSIEILRESLGGKPKLFLHKISENYHSSLSITHDGDYVWAITFLKLMS